MIPILYIGNYEIRTYYIMAIIGIIAGFFVLLFNLRNYNKTKKNKIFLFAILIFIPFVFGARGGYYLECILTKTPFCSSSFFHITGPTSIWWGLILATISAFLFAYILKLNVWEVADIFSISIAIGGVFIRIGCFFNGCCFGKPVDINFPLATIFPHFSYAGHTFPDIPIHPTQIYSSFYWFIIFIILILRKNKKQFHGELILIMAFLYSIFRFLIEFLRYHEVEMFLSVAQIFSIIIFILSLVLYFIFKKYNINKIS